MINLNFKKNLIRDMLVFLFLIHLINAPVLAIELDTSIDDDIRRNYNPSKIEDDFQLPPLPKALNAQSDHTVNYSNAEYKKPTTAPLQCKQSVSRTKQSFITIKEGTRLKLKLLNSISDKTPRGTQIVFETRYPISTTYYTIPAGTMLYGQIVRSHGPQFSGNGGLIEISINSMQLQGETQPIDAYVTKASSKHIFFNNIKGKRRYISSTFNSAKPGFRYFGKMFYVSKDLAQDKGSIILIPFALGVGVIIAAGNVVISPVLGFFHKGNSIYFSRGSNFEAKLAQDVFIYN